LQGDHRSAEAQRRRRSQDGGSRPACLRLCLALQLPVDRPVRGRSELCRDCRRHDYHRGHLRARHRKHDLQEQAALDGCRLYWRGETMMRVILVLALWLAALPAAAADSPIFGSWTITKAEPAPWVEPSYHATLAQEAKAYLGKQLVFAPGRVRGPQPLGCT